MRFVPTYCLREGMQLGDNLFGKNGELVLVQNTVLTRDYIQGIEKLNFNGIYVEDDISKDLKIVNIINERVRAETVRSIKEVFICSNKKSLDSKQKFMSMQNQIAKIVDEILENKHMMVNMVDLKVFDDYTYFHSVNVAVLSIVLGTALGLAKADLCDLGFGAILHDIGKVFVRKEILNKNGALSDDEFHELMKHSFWGYNYIQKGFGINTSSKFGIRDHHEKYGGGGYPNNIEGDDISLFGRIIAIADVYDAMTSDRPYRKAVNPSEVIEYIMGSSIVHFDPDLVAIFIRKIAPYPIGTCVKLSNGLTGIVTENYESYCMRPKIRIFKKGDIDVSPYEISLADNKSLNITVTDIA